MGRYINLIYPVPGRRFDDDLIDAMGELVVRLDDPSVTYDGIAETVSLTFTVPDDDALSLTLSFALAVTAPLTRLLGVPADSAEILSEREQRYRTAREIPA